MEHIITTAFSRMPKPWAPTPRKAKLSALVHQSQTISSGVIEAKNSTLNPLNPNRQSCFHKSSTLSINFIEARPPEFDFNEARPSALIWSQPTPSTLITLIFYGCMNDDDSVLHGIRLSQMHEKNGHMDYDMPEHMDLSTRQRLTKCTLWTHYPIVPFVQGILDTITTFIDFAKRLNTRSIDLSYCFLHDVTESSL